MLDRVNIEAAVLRPPPLPLACLDTAAFPGGATISPNGHTVTFHPKLVIFDWDGTLKDSIGPILLGFQRAYDRYGHPCPPADRLLATIGLPLAVAFERLTPGLPAATMVTLYREYWFDPGRPLSPWASGALEIMDWLERQGIAMAVATGKSRDGLNHELEAHGIAHRFAATRSADDAEPKPHPQMVEQILVQLEVAPQATILIGDSPLDISMGNAAGVTTYGVLGGVGSLEALRQARAHAVLAALAELKATLAPRDLKEKP